MQSKQEKIIRGKKLRHLREFYGISQQEFGEKLGLTRGSLNSYEHGQNPIPIRIIYKIRRTIGIGSEYFETNMTLQEALDRYNIQPNDIGRMSDFDEINCFVYDGIMNYANDNYEEKKFNLRFKFLSLLLGLQHKTTYHFVRLNNAIFEPFARNGDILVVLKDVEVSNGDFVITRFQQSYIIFQYFISGIDEVLFKGSNGIEIKLKDDEIKQIEILGIIKQRLSVGV